MMMTRKISTGFLGLMLALCFLHALPAQEKQAASATRHSVWKVRGQTNTVYLVGSIHVLKEEDYPLPSVIETAYSDSPIAVFETDIQALDDPAMAMKLMAKAKLPEGQTLQTQLSPETYKLFSEKVSATGMPAEMFNQFAPPMAAMTLEVLEMTKMNLDPKYGLDKHFFAKAKEDKKQIVPLETVDFQIGLLTDFTKEEGESLMKTTLKELDNVKKDLAELLNAWKTGDAARLAKLLNEAMQDAPVIYKRLLTDRNKAWIPKLEELARGNKNAMVVVGAGHLVGKDGVVELLRQKGFKVTQE
jgi:uncharacterized protein YbaP (TraB family)